MKNYAVFGAGLMGSVIARDLLNTESEARVTLIDSDKNTLEQVTEFVKRNRIKTYQLDITDTDSAVHILTGHDVAICALPHRFSLACIEAAIQSRVSLVDLVGEAPEQRQALHQKILDAGVIIIPGCGVAPGLSNICVAKGVSLLDETNEAVIYVGGIPKQKTPPLNYQTVYSLYSVFNAYNRPAMILDNGNEKNVEPLSGLEHIEFPGPIGTLEAFYTDGLASLTLTMKGKVKNHLAEKTLRYPGFVERIKFLKDCGLIDTKPVSIASAQIAPIELLIHQLTPKLKLGPAGDWLVMRVVVKGIKDGIKQTHLFELIDQFDPKTQYTAMARTTGFPATIAARMISDGLITERGIQFPEQVFEGERYDYLLSGLEKYEIKIRHFIE